MDFDPDTFETPPDEDFESTEEKPDGPDLEQEYEPIEGESLPFRDPGVEDEEYDEDYFEVFGRKRRRREDDDDEEIDEDEGLSE